MESCWSHNSTCKRELLIGVEYDEATTVKEQQGVDTVLLWEIYPGWILSLTLAISNGVALRYSDFSFNPTRSASLTMPCHWIAKCLELCVSAINRVNMTDFLTLFGFRQHFEVPSYTCLPTSSEWHTHTHKPCQLCGAAVYYHNGHSVYIVIPSTDEYLWRDTLTSYLVIYRQSDIYHRLCLGWGIRLEVIVLWLHSAYSLQY